ncbi:hypothetical protein K501DRAFT_199977, partial [Backusella circina FSU 941]
RVLFECPKNESRDYEPCKLNKVQMPSAAEQFDTHLHQIQHRLSGLACPLD